MKAVYRINGEQTSSQAVIEAIQSAPGFDGSGTYDLLRTRAGGIRVYRIVGGQPMDASLRDIDPSIFSREIHDILGWQRH